MPCVATVDERRIWCPGKCTGCVHDKTDPALAIWSRVDYSINCWTALKRAFPDLPDKEVNAYRREDLEHTTFMSEIVKYLEDNGYEFGCGRKNGCPPGCTC